MAVADAPRPAPAPGGAGYAPSPAGPAPEGAALRLPPAVDLPRPLATLRFLRRPLEFKAKAARLHGDVFRVPLAIRDTTFVFTSHPDHVRSLFTAKAGDVPSLT